MADKSKNNDQKRDLNTARLEVRGKTLVFDNAIYQIPNISAIEVGSTTRRVPTLFWFLLVVGAGLAFVSLDGGVSPLPGLVTLVAAALIFAWYWGDRKIHGLIIRLNSGFTEVIISKQLQFLKDVAIVLREIMDGEQDRSITFNLDNRTIVDNVSDSAVIVGDAKGDVVNRV